MLMYKCMSSNILISLYGLISVGVIILYNSLTGSDSSSDGSEFERSTSPEPATCEQP